MNTKEIFQKTKGIISSFYDETEQAKIAQEQSLRDKEKRETEELERQLEKQRQVDERWPTIKDSLLKLLEEINEEVLEGNGEVVGWQKKKVDHEHSKVLIPARHWDDEALREKRRYKFQVEQAQLRIRNVGSVVIIRPLHSEDRRIGYESSKKFKKGRIGTTNVYLFGLFLKDGRLTNWSGFYGEKVCPECGNIESSNLVSLDPQHEENFIDSVKTELIVNLLSIHSVKFKGKPFEEE